MRLVNQMIASFSTKQLLLLTALVCCYWLYTWWSVAGLERRSSSQLRADILLLSELYVRALAREQKEAVDGPFAGRLTGGDLKRTMAVLLENIMERLDRLEQRMANVTAAANETSPVDVTKSSAERSRRRANHAAAFSANQMPRQPVTCGLSGSTMTNTMRALWPECEEKLEWMRKHWRSDACYSNYGVDGSFCSFFFFLSEVENFCPKLSSKNKLPLAGRPANLTSLKFAQEHAKEFAAVTAKVVGPSSRDFRARAAELWLDLSSAGQRLLARAALAPTRRRLRIALFPSLLINISDASYPVELSEEARQLMLRQWADLTVSLFQLGHELTMCGSLAELKRILRRFPDAKSPCQARKNLFLDLLYTDHVGLSLFRRLLGAARFSRFNCLLRVLDPFGTEPAFNFFPSCKACGFNLSPRQYLTLTPAELTPDNSFLGLVLLASSPAGLQAPTAPLSRPVALLHVTKDSLPPSSTLLNALRGHFRPLAVSLDATLLPETAAVLSNARLGLSWPAYAALLQQARLFVGLGSPVDSAMALMALASGCAVLNPVRATPVALRALQLGWPSARLIGAQFTYLQRHLKPPYVLSWADGAQLTRLLTRAARSPRLEPLVPPEFGAEAFLQRLDLFVQRQDLCEGTAGGLGPAGASSGRVLWPPASAVLFYLGVLGDSCEETCRKRRLICEPAHFAGINSRIELQERGLRCDRIAFEAAPENPNFLPPSSTCTFQSEPRLFSCAGAKPGVMRLCPCRDALPGQTALCSSCL